MSQVSESFVAIRMVIATVVKSGSNKVDNAGQYLHDAAIAAGHQVLEHVQVAEDRYSLRAKISAWIADSEVQVILVNGGTGMTERDQVPEALLPLFDREITGFGELFRMLSYEEIGTSTLQSRAVAGLANQTLIFAMPGSPSACHSAWEKIICPQLDARQRPCNFHSYLKK